MFYLVQSYSLTGFDFRVFKLELSFHIISVSWLARCLFKIFTISAVFNFGTNFHGIGCIKSNVVVKINTADLQRRVGLDGNCLVVYIFCCASFRFAWTHRSVWPVKACFWWSSANVGFTKSITVIYYSWPRVVECDFRFACRRWCKAISFRKHFETRVNH